MKSKYKDLVEQSFDWPVEGFEERDNQLLWQGVDLMEVIKQYGTPLKISYLPKISENIKKARQHFNVARAKLDYQGDYNYCYCTKSSHFSFVIDEVIKNNVHLETSSAFDINIIESLAEQHKIDKDIYIVCNGYKRPQYLENIARLINSDFKKVIPVIDNVEELDALDALLETPCSIGVRIASEEEPKFEFYTSRLGIGYKDIVSFYKKGIEGNTKFNLKMLHFFINTGIKDNAYYWNELRKCVNVYIQLKKVCPTIDSLNIGGGFPIQDKLNFDYDYGYMAEEILGQIKKECNAAGVDEPHIFTEFGSYTVGESGATFFSIMGQKKQNDRESWSMIDGSFMTSLPDSWAINKRFIMLPINRWNKEYQRVLLGGLTCDSDDYYNSEQHVNAIFLPRFNENEKLFIGFFHTGAYQESLGGFGGIQHCLIPAPKHVILDKDKDGNITTKLFAKEQSYKSMMKVLGY
ncbi:MAG: arginine decarboxylase [Schleiferiaceae bacterium]|jgi:arginine decarboxylase|nr:arginine decarboxylase [Schleiferiaceae bacterium]